MASLASLVTLGSARQNPSLCFDSSPVVIQRISIVGGGGSFSNSLGGWKWGFTSSVCKCMATTNLVTELESTPLSAESTLKGSKDEDTDLVLKPSPKPVLKDRPKVEHDLSVSPMSSFPQAPKKLARDSLDKESVEYKDKVIESLEEVLEKAEKLEAAHSSRMDIKKTSGADGKPMPVRSTAHPTPVTSSNSRVGRPVNSVVSGNTKTSKSVWRKGNPVTAVQRAVKVEKENSKMDVVEKEEVQPQPKVPLKPQAPPKVQPMLQAKPAAVAPAVKKPMILKDVGASPKPSVSNSADVGLKTKERKTILVDKFAAKKQIVDPMMAQEVIAPPKPIKSTSISKVKDERRKRAGAAGGLRRRLVDKSGNPDEEASELGVPIPGAKVVRKGRKWSKASRKAARLEAAKAAVPVKVEILEVGDDGMSSEELAYNLAVSEADIFGYLFSKGIKPDTVQTLDKDMVKMICKEYDVEVIETDPVRVEEMAVKKKVVDEEDSDMLEVRPPVLTIMGHVDHGKTTLLDYIRKSKVAASEAGGITQGIGAYKVLVPVDGKLQSCVFLDTPGHEAFGAMRARGTRVTDIAVIVVAADDGVRPQTNEAIAHAKAAGVPIVIAINKIDKDGANPEKVMQELSSVGLMPEDWGGDVPMVQISALKGENVDDLLETVLLIAEMQELKANPHRNAKGTVIEAGLHKSKGPVATLIIQNGTLRKGNVVVCGGAFGKVRALFDDRGGQVNEAGPSTAVQVIGLNNVPIAGDEFEVMDSLDIAREKAETRADSLRVERISAKASEGKVTLSSIAASVSGGKQSGLDMHQLNLILKVDVQGSIEAIRHALQLLPQDNVSLKFLLQAPGDVSTSDVDLAVATKAIIFGFNVKTSGSVESYADNKGIEIRIYRVIYELIDDMRKAMEGLLEPVEEQIPMGAADIRAIFSSGSGHVAGCMVTEGKVVKGCGVRVIRNGKTVYVGTLDSLRRVKEMVKEVNAGLECGIGMDNFMDFEVGDVIEAFNTVKKQRTLEEASASVTAALAGAGVQR